MPTSETAAPEHGHEPGLWNPRYILLFVINLVMSMTLYMTNTTMAQFLGSRGISAAAAGSVIGAMSIASMLARPVSGWLCDRFERRKGLMLCTAVTAAVMTGYALAGNTTVFLVLRALHGAAFAVTTTITMALVAETIPRTRIGEGMGYFGMGQSVAAALGPSAGIGIAQGFGWLGVFVAAAVLALGCTVLVMTSGRGRKPEEHAPRAAAGNGRLRVQNFIAPEALPYAVITIALSAANGIETSYVAGYAASVGIPSIGWYFTVSAATLFAARLVLGRLTDRKGFLWVFAPGIALIAAGLFLLSGITPEHAIPLFAAAAAVKAVGVGALQPGIQAMCVRAVPPERRGAASSTYYIGADLGQGGSTMLAGGIIAERGYPAMFQAYIVPLAAALLLYPLLRRRPAHAKPEPPGINSKEKVEN